MLCSGSLEFSFIMLSVCSKISYAFVISWSQSLYTLSLSPVIDCSPYDFWSTFICSLSQPYSCSSCYYGSSGSSGSLFILSERSSILRYVMESSSIEDCSRNGLICDVEYRLITLSGSLVKILGRSSWFYTVKVPMNSPKRLFTVFRAILTLFLWVNTCSSVSLVIDV